MSKYCYRVALFFLGCILLLGTVFSSSLVKLFYLENEYDLKRFMVLFYICFVSGICCFSRKFFTIPFSRLSKYSVMLLFIFSILSSLEGDNSYWSFVELCNLICLFVMFSMLTNIMRCVECFSLKLYVYIIALFFTFFTFSKYIIFLVFHYIDIKHFGINDLIYGYVNVRFFNQLQVFFVPVLFIPFFDLKYNYLKKISIFLISFHWVVILQTEARGAGLGIVVSAAFISLVIDRSFRNNFLLVMVKTMLLGFIFWFLFIYLISYFIFDDSNFHLRVNSSGRLDLWYYSFQRILDSFWLGYGPMSFAWGEERPLPNSHPHNSLIMLMYEYGVVVFVVMAFWLFRLLLAFIRLLENKDLISNMPIIFSLLSGVIYSFVSGVVVMPFSQAMLVLMMAVYFSLYGFRLDEVKSWYWMRFFQFIFVTTIVIFIANSYNHEGRLDALFPRLWLNGLIKL
ncbi:O-antigen ligase family protein [Shewanella algae]|uniref:O-antigen ligase family protein n=1 Tax=Shewanella algae TaxID=38313 RepID=UPI001AADDCF2|nr:O-antigen ligase family protein [Shewanella algae]MBO2601933.1 O-antigen ligase family protein [Shewanella algae]